MFGLEKQSTNICVTAAAFKHTFELDIAVIGSSCVHQLNFLITKEQMCLHVVLSYLSALWCKYIELVTISFKKTSFLA